MPQHIQLEELENLDFEYSPSRHCKRYKSADEAIKNHMEFIEKESNRVRGDYGLKYELDVKYGESEDEVLDIYYTSETKATAPIFLYIHGGYWQMLTKDSYANCVRPLVTAGGYKVFIANYSLCPKVSLADIVKQIRVLFEFTHHYALEHGARFVSVCGHSAGAHLILAALQCSHYYNAIQRPALNGTFKNAYLVSGIYDLTQLRYIPSINADNILGISDQNVERLSPYFQNFCHLTGMKFKFLVGEHESKTFCKQSRDMQMVLARTAYNCASSFEVVAEVDHFNIIENLTSEDFLISRYVILDAK